MAQVSVNPTGIIVVGVDGSDESVRALEWAIEDARRRGARVIAVTGFEIPWTIAVTPTYTENDYGQDAADMLALTLEKFHASHPDVEVESQLLQGKPALVLTEAARNADLLVVGSHGYGALPGMHLGSVATYCVHHAYCPVLVHRSAE
jgi:nucleotide-binding universal stress UspA family protein